jgi:hypothetical protein
VGEQHHRDEERKKNEMKKKSLWGLRVDGWLVSESGGRLWMFFEKQSRLDWEVRVSL